MSVSTYALDKYSTLYEDAAVSYSGSSYYCTDIIAGSFSYLLPRSYEENGAGIRSVFMPHATVPIEMTNSQYIALVDAAQDAIQELTDIYYQIAQLINSGTITTDAQVDSTWTTLTSSYSNNRIQEPTNEILNAMTTRTQSSVSRSLNAAFQISSTQDAFVNYSVNISCTISLTSGQSGTVILEIASDSGFTQNVQTVANFGNANSGALTSGLNLTQAIATNLCGFVPMAYYCRLRTVNTTGTPSFTFLSGQETLL